MRLKTFVWFEMNVSSSAKVRDDGTFSGYMSTPRGEMKFTAEREKAKQ